MVGEKTGKRGAVESAWRGRRGVHFRTGDEKGGKTIWI